MSDLPKSVRINEEGPREGFQMERGPISNDTRGLAIADAYAGLEMGVDMFDASVAGLGGCPFGAHKGAGGNVCTEDLVFMYEEMGISTGVDLDALIACAELAEEVVGHPLPGSVKMGGNLNKLRAASH